MPPLDTDVQFVTGVGPRRAAALRERGVHTVEDLLYHLPFRYEDRGSLVRLRDAAEGAPITVAARVVQSALRRTRRRGFSVFTALLDDGTASMRAVFFNQPYLERTLTRGAHGVFHGRLVRDPRSGGIQLQNPSFEITPEEGHADELDRIVPIHPKLPGLTPRQLRALLHRLLDALPDPLPPSLPEELERRHGLVDRRRALHDVHFPPPGADPEEYTRRASEAHRRLIFEELFAMQLAFLVRRREAGQRAERHRYVTSREIGDRLRALLPFRLTAGQRAAFREILEDLRRPQPMARLLQGDVGSGKTIVALLAMLLAAENGFQAALMAPTEIVAEQHARRFREVLRGRREVGLLTGSLPRAERRRVLGGLRDGGLSLVVGTHALIQDDVAFADLALAVVDEQHRFGVEQRVRLAAKGLAPDVLVMTATPIPRTLALTLHGDLDVTTIADRPPGRRPVRTAVRDERSRPAVLRFLRDEVAAGRQAYVVHPLIEESEDADLRAATESARSLARALPAARVGLVHGGLRPDEREEVMREFTAGRIDVLVATTVVEVGVDVANATLMVVENAERFGLSQLHQLRGRVGRGESASWCILMRGRAPTAEGLQRLAMLERTEDGFLLAETDLQMRGAGELFGLRQVGLRDLRVADPLRDREILLAARQAAVEYLEGLPEAARASDPLARSAEQRWQPVAERSAAG